MSADFTPDFQFPSKMLYLGKIKYITFFYEALALILLSCLIYFQFNILWGMFVAIIIFYLCFENRTKMLGLEHILGVPCGNCWFCKFVNKN